MHYVALRRSPWTRAERSTVLVERAAELAAMTSVLRSARRGAGGLVVVSGPLGIGKTVLLNAFAEQASADGARVLRAAAAPLERDFAFGVVRQLFHAPVRTAEPARRAAWLGAAAAAARPLLDDDPARVRRYRAEHPLFEGLRALVANMAARTPLLLLVDDLQWTDLPSLRCLGFLADRLATLPVVIAVAAHQGDHHAGPGHLAGLTSSAREVLSPRPLSARGSARLVRAVFAEADDEFLLACHERAAGNPMVLTAILRALEAGGTPPRGASADVVRSALPGRLRERLLSFLRQLPPAALKLATAVAVVGDPVERDVLAGLAGLDATEAGNAERALRLAGVFTASPAGPRFAHPAVRAAVDELLPMADREELHLAAARSLHRHGCPAERIAGLLLGVDRPQGTWAVEAVRAAAVAAARDGRPARAVEFLRHALRYHAQDGPGRAELLVDLATVEGRYDAGAAVRHLAQAVPMLPTAAGRAAAVLPFAPLAPATAPEPVAALVRQAAEDLGAPARLSGAERDLALRLGARLRPHGHGGRFAALAGEPATSTCAERELSAVLLHEAAQRMTLPAARVAELANRLLAAEPPDADHPHPALPLLVSVLITADATAGLALWLEAALKRAHARNAPVVYRGLCAQSALVHLHTGDFGPARAAAVEAWELSGDEPAEPITATLALTAVRTGDLRLATDRLDPAYERNRARCTRPFWRLFDGMLAAERGEFARAAERVLDCGRALDRECWYGNGILPWRAMTAELCLRAGDLGQAKAIAAEDHRSVLTWGAPGPLGRALRVRADVLGGHRAVALLREAVEVLGRSENKVELAIAKVRLGRALTAHGSPRQAAGLLREGRELAESCGAAHLVESQGGQASTAASAEWELTAAEARVARYAVGGATNQDIANALRVSTRAVEKQLTKVYRKLGVAGRAGLPAALAVSGQDD
ncbi:ATP-binding protein [Amycolatopsis sp. NPDC059027]|uniref:ATP-binding protein n=1 Tax=Amycolatopsis sp. NPDC059027 TaxID=3346709 RepID=UPI003671331B